jgi:hypothetical protein
VVSISGGATPCGGLILKGHVPHGNTTGVIDGATAPDDVTDFEPPKRIAWSLHHTVNLKLRRRWHRESERLFRFNPRHLKQQTTL